MNNKQFKYEINLVLVAITFFTRIPISLNVDFSSEMLNRAGRYFSLAGYVIGCLSAIVFYLFDFLLPESVALVISMLFSILLTGSFHEDGLADTCDGFGGAWGAEQKIKIMKDSRIGTYGAVALWFALTLKFQLLIEVHSVALALIVAHPLSRSFSTCMIYFLPYVGDKRQSKIKPLAEKLRLSDLLINLLIGIVPILLITNLTLIDIAKILMILVVLFVLLKMFYIKQIGGFTGDTLGASQQVSELLIYMLLITII